LGVIYGPEAWEGKFGDSSDRAKIWRNFSRHVAQRKTGLNSLFFTKAAIFLDTRNQFFERRGTFAPDSSRAKARFPSLPGFAAPGSEWDNKFPV
jgi:hypothetical protein